MKITSLVPVVALAIISFGCQARGRHTLSIKAVHQVKIHVECLGGEVGFHLSYGLDQNWFTRNDFTKLFYREDSNRLKPGDVADFDQGVDANDFILDFSEWVDVDDAHPAKVKVTLNIDGLDEFIGEGSDHDIGGWTRTLGTHAQQTDDREIRIQF